MNGRSNKVRMWLEQIADDINKNSQIFFNNLITVDDIGEEAYNQITKQFDKLNVIFDELLFSLDSR